MLPETGLRQQIVVKSLLGVLCGEDAGVDGEGWAVSDRLDVPWPLALVGALVPASLEEGVLAAKGRDIRPKSVIEEVVP
jgi:hypothetical protein